MIYALCSIPIAPLRLQPNHTAEMVSQLLFGERCVIEEKNNEGWCKVVCKIDNYNGWCLLQQLSTITEEVYNRKTQPTAEWVTEIEFNNQVMQVPFGSELDVDKFELLKPTQQNVAEAAHQFLNTSYLWGGKTVFGTDCSGFTQTIFKLFGIYLPRDAKQQVLVGEEVPFLQQAHSGDLAFFDEDGSIVHVGVLLNNSHIIHASGKVQIDKIDTEGIINTDDGTRSKQKLRLIKRYF